MRQLLNGDSELFSRGNKIDDKDEELAKEAELFKQIGWLQMQLELLRTFSAALMPVNCICW